MSQCQATQQADNVIPPRRGKIISIAVDSTARPYDLTTISLGAAYQDDKSNDFVFVTLFGDPTNAVWYQLSNVTASDLDDTTKIAAGGALAFANTYGVRLASGGAHSFRIQRNVDKFLILKCAAGLTGIVQFCASSQPSPSAIGHTD